MPRYKLHIAYDGTDFSGWQRQPADRTIQGEIEKAISTIYQQKTEISGAGRTDAGVHAEGQIAHVDLDTEPADDFQNRLNKLLWPDTSIIHIEEVSDDFHARFDATWRQYRYDILLKPNPIFHRTAWYVFHPVDVNVFRETISGFQGIHDFRNFSKHDPQQDHTKADVHFVETENISEHHLRVRIRANRFLRNMVRRLVGFSVDVSKGKIEPELMHELLQPVASSVPVYTAPANGLVLEAVGYDD